MLILFAQAQAVLSKFAYWQRLEAANPSFTAEFRNWTASFTSEALPIRYVISFQFPDGGRPALADVNVPGMLSCVDQVAAGEPKFMKLPCG